MISAKPAGPIGTFLQTNFLGFPVIHQKQSWTFDPESSLRRRDEFINKHGHKGDKLIENLGLGDSAGANNRS